MHRILISLLYMPGGERPVETVLADADMIPANHCIARQDMMEIDHRGWASPRHREN